MTVCKRYPAGVYGARVRARQLLYNTKRCRLWSSGPLRNAPRTRLSNATHRTAAPPPPPPPPPTDSKKIISIEYRNISSVPRGQDAVALSRAVAPVSFSSGLRTTRSERAIDRHFAYTNHEMPHSYEHIVDAQQSSVGDELYNLTQLAEVSIVYFRHHTTAIIDGPSDYEKVVKKNDADDDGDTLTTEQTSKKTTNSKERQCPDCGKSYSTSSNLARHRQTHRSLADTKARHCPHCDKVYVSIPAFSMHMRTHSQSCKCSICGKCFSRPWLLQGHIRTHTGEKPYECEKCRKAFADKSNLRAHLQTHSTEKPHVCQKCNKAFALKSYLYKHEESACGKITPLNNNND